MTSGEITENSEPLSDDSIPICKFEEDPSESKSSDNIYHCLLNDFYGFDHNNTKWILKSLSSNIGLKRLQLCKDLKLKMLRSYYEIPDNPVHYNILNKESVSLNTPAFHPLASLYLNPLGISIYIRNESALRIILQMKINSFSDPCFVQRWWSKGDDKYLTDFSTINILALALRRSFMDGISIMMSSELDPKDRFYHIDHIQSANSSKTHVHQDGLDLAFNMLYERPGLDIGRYFKIIVDKKMKNYYRIISFEMNTVLQMENSNTMEKIRLCSLFRIILKRAVQSYNYKFSAKYLSILEIIQHNGFFRYLHGELRSKNNDQALLLDDHKQFCEENFYPGDEIESQRLYKSDIAKLPDNYRIGCLLLDRTLCLGLLMLWLIETKKRERNHLKNKLAKLIINILIDSSIVIWFLQTPDNILADTISTPCCKVGPILEEDITLCKSIMIEVIQQSNILKTKIYKRITKISTTIHSLSFNKQNTKKKHHSKKSNKPDYLMCNSHTIQSWNQPQKEHELQLSRHYKSEEIPILSLKHKFGKIVPPFTVKTLDLNKAHEIRDFVDIKCVNKYSCSETNSLDSVDEIVYSNQDSFPKYRPPPLVISKQKPLLVNSMKIEKKDFATGDNIDLLSDISKDEDDSTLIEELLKGSL